MTARPRATRFLRGLLCTSRAASCALVTLASCAPPPGPPRPPPARPVPRSACPLGVDGAQVFVDDTDGGIAIVFTSAEKESELRERVRAVAGMHGPFGRRGLGHGGQHGSFGQHGLRAVGLPRLRADVTDVDGGARLVLVPIHPAQLEELRTRVRERTAKMRVAPCDT